MTIEIKHHYKYKKALGNGFLILHIQIIRLKIVANFFLKLRMYLNEYNIANIIKQSFEINNIISAMKEQAK